MRQRDRQSAPAFARMVDGVRAGQTPRRYFPWRIAAVALLSAGVLSAVLWRPRTSPTTPGLSHSSPTVAQGAPARSACVDEIANWQSPTDFLLNL